MARRVWQEVTRRIPLGAVVLFGAALAHGQIPHAWDAVWEVFVVAVGIVAFWSGIRRHRPVRNSGWYRIAIALTWYAATAIVLMILTDVVGSDHAGTAAIRLVGLAAVPVGLTGVRLLLAAGHVDVDREARMDSHVITLAVLYIGWQAFLSDMVQREGLLSVGVIGANVYWIASVAVLGLVLSRGLGSRGGTPSLWLFAAALPAIALSSMSYWAQEPGVAWESAPAAQVLVVLALASLAASAWHPSMVNILGTATDPADGPVRLWSQWVLVGIAAATVPLWQVVNALGWVRSPDGDVVGPLLGLCVIGAAVLRVGMTLRARNGAEVTIRMHEARFRSLVENAFEGLIIADADGQVTWGSDSSGRVAGLSKADHVGRNILDDVDPTDVPRLRALYATCVASPGSLTKETVCVKTENGHHRWIEFSWLNRLHDPAVAGVVINYRDVTEHYRIREQLRHQATHDSLTNLPNRTALLSRMHDLATDSGSDHAMAVLFLDLDNFKAVNDSHGHATGDRLLQTVADRLREVLDTDALVARIGGDEFVALIEAPQTLDEVLFSAARLSRRLVEPMDLDGHVLSTSASIGVAMAAGETPGDLLRQADIAMYRAKQHRTGSTVVFDPTWQDAPGRPSVLETLQHA